MFVIISNQILKMFLILILGYVCYHIKMIDHQGNKVLSNLLLMVINPFLIVNAFQIEYDSALMHGFLLSFLLALLTHFVGMILARLLIPEKGNRDYHIERFSCIYSNCGFMGIPLVSSILGNEGILYLTAYMVAFNLLCWTQGLILMTGNMSWKQLKKGLTSPAMFAIVFGFLLFALQIRVPAVLSDTIEYISAMNTPTAMLVAGVSLAETNLLDALKNKRLYLVTAIKLLVIPLLMAALFLFLPWDKKVLCTILVAAACPTATTGTMFALRYNANYKYASEIFALSTLISLVTIPLIISLAERFIL